MLAARHGGELVKSLGDAVMLRCDEVGAAIDLGLALVGAHRDRDDLPPVRVGVHRGPAIGRDGDWYGHSVNVASRLCSVAGGGQVLVSEAAWEEAGELRAVKAGERRLHWLKNVTEPVPARLAAIRGRPWRRRRWCPRSKGSLQARVA